MVNTSDKFMVTIGCLIHGLIYPPIGNVDGGNTDSERSQFQCAVKEFSYHICKEFRHNFKVFFPCIIQAQDPWS